MSTSLDLNESLYRIASDILRAESALQPSTQRSVCELSISRQTYDEDILPFFCRTNWKTVCSVNQRVSFVQIGERQTSRYELFALIFTVAITELARRHSSEASFWPRISTALSHCDYHRQLFDKDGQPTRLTRRLIHDASIKFNLRHVFDTKGYQEWYVSLLLQFGLTQDALSKRLPHWLKGPETSLAIELLRKDPGLSSQHFVALWHSLLQFQRGRIEITDLRKQTTGNPWVPTDWPDEQIIALRNAPLSFETEPEEDPDSFLSQPRLSRNTAPSRPQVVVDLQLQNMAKFGRQELQVRVGDDTLAKIYQQQNGSIVAVPSILNFHLEKTCWPVRLTDKLGTTLLEHSLSTFSPEADDFTLFDANSGEILHADDTTQLSSRTEYGILLYNDLTTSPRPIQKFKINDHLDVVYLPRLDSGGLSILEKDSCPSESLYAFPTHSSTGPEFASLRISCRIRDNRSLSITIRNPLGLEVVKLRLNRETLQSSSPEADSATLKYSVPAVTDAQLAKGISLAISVRYLGCLHYTTRRVSIDAPGIFTLTNDRWHKLPSNRTLSTFECAHNKFIVSQIKPEQAIDTPPSYYLIEGNRFHGSVRTKAGELGFLTGLGEPLGVFSSPFNTSEPTLQIASAIYDQGIIKRIEPLPQGRLKIKLNSSIDWRDGHQLIALHKDLSVATLEVVPPGSCTDTLEAFTLAPAESIIAFGIFYNGSRIGSAIHSTNKLLRAIQVHAFKDAERWLKVAKIFLLPVLKPKILNLSKRLVRENVSSAIAIWCASQIPLDGQTFSNQWDDRSEYALNQLVGNRPISLSGSEATSILEALGLEQCPPPPYRTAWLIVLFGELTQLSPIIAAATLKAVINTSGNPAPFSNAARAALIKRLIHPHSETQLLRLAATQSKTDEGFIRMMASNHDESYNKTNNFLRLLHLSSFRILATLTLLKA